MRNRLLGCAVVVVLAACSNSSRTTAPPTPPTPPTSPGSSPAPTSTPSTQAPGVPPVVPHVVVSGLRVPWGLAFLPDGSALVSERDTARIHRVTAAGADRVVATVPHVVPDGEGGLLGLAVSDSYGSDHWVYAYYTAASDNRVVRFRLADPGQQQVLISGIPKAGRHNGGRLAFGPDGMLYVGTGDAGDTSHSQSTQSLGGKVLRLRPSGGAAPGNPFGNAVWSYGHRNVQGLAFDPQGRLWATEFGQDTWDEINLIQRGRDYGWPVVEGPGTGGGRFVAPKVVWRTDDASPSGLAYGGGELHAAALHGMRLWDIPLQGTATGTPRARFRNTYGRIRTVALTPDGRALWLMTSNCDGRGDCGAQQDVIVQVPL